ncbi:Hsp20/alpha crystallin family protein [Loigolactobacillus coryniformis]|uniref:Hsp20/alpha crystallin family protein n=1 Tax=Loigolactobacillus coryniformis TaxID=1610 RepID=A0A5B8TIX1_9LACO|nr:Hsp20/alpha crystallin family protein [Loigolactobacillus coryniformis]QEA52409.1 Hsp20/alpha crystallin family protein [Loigolactobacillus coryniformis]
MANEITNEANDRRLDPFDRLARQFFGNYPSTFNDKVLRTDIKEREHDYVVAIDVPGIEKKDIHLNYDNDTLSISVRKDSFGDHEDKDGNLLMSERQYGRMSRSYRLPNVDSSGITAKNDNGILTITLPKRADSAASHIEIE